MQNEGGSRRPFKVSECVCLGPSLAHAYYNILCTYRNHLQPGGEGGPRHSCFLIGWHTGSASGWVQARATDTESNKNRRQASSPDKVQGLHFRGQRASSSDPIGEGPKLV